MVSIPDRDMFSPPGGFGVAARDGGTGVIERDRTPASLLSFDSRDHSVSHRRFLQDRSRYTYSCCPSSTTSWRLLLAEMEVFCQDLSGMARTRHQEGCCGGNCESAGIYNGHSVRDLIRGLIPSSRCDTAKGMCFVYSQGLAFGGARGGVEPGRRASEIRERMGVPGVQLDL